VSIGDLAAALYGVIAILSALRLRERTGVGRHLDVAMLDCQVALLEDALARYSATGKVPAPLGSRHPSITPFQQFRAADGYFVAGAGNESLWMRFCDAIGTPELKSDPRFGLNAERTANHAELEPLLNRHFAAKPRDHWLKLLGEAGVPCAPIANVAEVTRNPHLQARQMILHADHPAFDGLIVPGSPFKTAGKTKGAAAIPDTRAPTLGEHTERVLREVAGYDAEKIAALRDDGVI
jgi:CoA:oxalate CoA-transferase